MLWPENNHEERRPLELAVNCGLCSGLTYCMYIPPVHNEIVSHIHVHIHGLRPDRGRENVRRGQEDVEL